MTGAAAQPDLKVKVATMSRAGTTGLTRSKALTLTNLADVYGLAPAERIPLIECGVAAGDVRNIAKTIGGLGCVIHSAHVRVTCY